MTQRESWIEGGAGARVGWTAVLIGVVALLGAGGDLRAQENASVVPESSAQSQETPMPEDHPGRLDVEATCEAQTISIELEADQTHFVLRIPDCVCFRSADGLEKMLQEGGWTGGTDKLALTRVLDFGETMPTETYYCYPSDVVDQLMRSHSVPPPIESSTAVGDTILV